MNRLFRDPAAGGAGGGLSPSLSDIEPKEGDNNLPNLEEEQQKQALIDTEADDGNGGLKPGYEKDDAGVIRKVVTSDLPDGVNADGSLQEGYQRNDDGTVSKIKEAGTEDEPAETDPDDTDPEEFFKAVDAITGTELKVDYPEGTDPLSPEGIAHREKTIRDDEALKFEETIKDRYPRAHAYMLHLSNGGKDEDFFSGPSVFTLPSQDELAASPEKQEAVYRFDLRSKELDDDAINALVEKAIKDGKLKEKADVSYTGIAKAQKAQEEAITSEAAAREEHYNKVRVAMAQNISRFVDKDMTFVVGDKDKEDFKKYVGQVLRYDPETDKVLIIKPVDDQNFAATIEALFFEHKKGDLGQLIKKAAKTQAAQGMRINIKKAEKNKGDGAAPENGGKKYVTLGEL